MKYQGSKNRHGKEILDAIKKDCDYYSYDNWIEPFVGGANMIDKVNGIIRYGYDKNEYVIELLRHVQAGGELPDYIDELQYKFVKDNKDLQGFAINFPKEKMERKPDWIRVKAPQSKGYFETSFNSVLFLHFLIGTIFSIFTSISLERSESGLRIGFDNS
jgi:DNA adenine methylase